jgi:alpha-L-fucosidase 2
MSPETHGNHMGGTDMTAANERLWYRHPAADWDSQALHLGNGWFGASFFGGVARERFALGEKTFWTGGPGDAADNDYGIVPGGREHIAEIRRLILEGRIPEADALWSRTMQGDRTRFGALSTVGDLFLDFEGHEGPAANYLRALDLRRAVGSVSYELAGVRYHREYFCSHPARALVMRIACDRPGGLTFAVGVGPAHRERGPVVTVAPARGLWELGGRIDDNNRPYRVKILVRPEGGSLVEAGGEGGAPGRRLGVRGAGAVTVVYTVATDYLQRPPLYRGADPEAITAGVLAKLESRDYASLRDEHVADYQGLYGRTRLRLAGGRPDREELPTDERWRFFAGHDYADLGLKELVFNLGKYLIVAASRPGSLPAGLQGPWSCHYRAPWNGNYQININIPLIYAAGNVLGLSECNRPFLDWIRASVIPGRAVARAYYGTGGWVSHATGNIWGHVAPGDDIEWGAFPSGAAWECRHLWEQYEFTGDEAGLREAYPAMKEAAQFWLENLAERRGALVAIPAVSAEHRSPKGFLLPPMQDIILVRDLFDNTARAAEILGLDPEFRERLVRTRERLVPLAIGRLGQLQEWVEDVDDPNCHHRHFMQLLAVHPCGQIDPHSNPALAAAARVSMNLRGDGDDAQRLAPGYRATACSCRHCGEPADPHIGGNWSRAWKCWIWARLLDGDRAEKIFSEMIGEAGMENLCGYQQVPDGRRPMQLDGSATAPGFMAEMLLQSRHGEIHLLPALPKAWAGGGEVAGLCARGNVTVDIAWKDGRVTAYRLRAPQPGRLRVSVNGAVETVEPEPIGR